MSKSLGILLHGVGSTGNDIAPVGIFLSETIAEMGFEAPDAPISFGFGGGRQWFSVEGVTVASRPQRIVAAREQFDHILK